MTRAGRVVRVDVDSCMVRIDDGPEVRADAWPLPTVGDEVVLDEDADRVAEIRPRRTELVRADSRRRQVLAANVDVVFVVVPLDRLDLLADDVERQIALAMASGGEPVVVLTKSDVGPDPDFSRRLPGVPVVVTSARTGEGVEGLAAALRPDRTGVLLGPSGAGKSTLVNHLVGSELLAVGDTKASGEGRHTTTARRLVAVPGGGSLIDIPGLRSLGLAAAAEGVARLYADVEELTQHCRFPDCTHEAEPGCALLEDIASGALDAERVERWKRLRAEAAGSAPGRRRRRS